VIDNSVTVPAGQTLTINPGAVVKFSPSYGSLYDYGTITAQGTSASPIYFTSLKDDTVGGDTNNDGTASTAAPGDWATIYLGPNANAALSYATVRYGGSGVCCYYS